MPNLVRCADITYIHMKRGYLFPVTTMDWHSQAPCPGGAQTRWMRFLRSRP